MKRSKRKSLPPFSLRTALTIPYVVLTVVLATTIALLSYSTGLSAVESLASRFSIDVVQRVSQAIDRHLVGSWVALEAVIPTAVGTDSKVPPDLDELEKRMSVATSLHTNPNNYVYYGNRSGQFIGVNRRDAKAIEIRLKTTAEEPRRFFEVTANSPKRIETKVESTIYDPRLRPWYRLAVEKQKAVWTPVYVDYTSGELVITRSIPVLNMQNEIEGVMGTDVSLKRLSDFVGSLKLTQNGVAFMVDGNGDLIAASSGEPLSKLENGIKHRVNAADSGNELIRATYAQFTDVIRARGTVSTPSQSQFSSNLGAVSAALDMVENDGGLRWYSLVAVPRKDVVGDLTYSVVRTAVVATVAALIAVFVGLWILNWVARDLKLLVQATKRIREGHLDEPVSIFRNDEIGELARSFERMHVDLQIDDLTGSYNRETFVRLLDRHIREASMENVGKNAQAFSLLFIDTDRFKSINDEYGHHVGDRVLQLVAERIKACVRDGDIVARYGGDEFVVLLKGVAQLANAKLVASKISDTVAMPIDGPTLKGHRPLDITVSIGLAIFPEDGKTANDLMRVADKRMYSHKRLRKQ